MWKIIISFFTKALKKKKYLFFLYFLISVFFSYFYGAWKPQQKHKKDECLNKWVIKWMKTNGCDKTAIVDSPHWLDSGGFHISTILIRFSRRFWKLNEKWRNRNHKNEPKKTKITFCWPAWTTSSAPCKSHMTKSHDEHVIGWKGEVQERGAGPGAREAGPGARGGTRRRGNKQAQTNILEMMRTRQQNYGGEKKNRTKTKRHKQKNQEKQKLLI